MSKATHGIGRPRPGTWAATVSGGSPDCGINPGFAVRFPTQRRPQQPLSQRSDQRVHPYFWHFPMTSCCSYNQKGGVCGGGALLGDKSHATDLGKKFFPCLLLALVSPGEREPGGWGWCPELNNGFSGGPWPGGHFSLSLSFFLYKME